MSDRFTLTIRRVLFGLLVVFLIQQLLVFAASFLAGTVLGYFGYTQSGVVNMLSGNNLSSVVFNLILMILSELLYLELAYNISSKAKAQIAKLFYFNKINILYATVAVLIAGAFVFVSSEIENLTSQLVGRNPVFYDIIISVVEYNDPVIFVTAVLVISLMPALVEEVLFRGVIQNGLVNRYGAVKGIIMTSILFAVIHINPATLISVFLMSMMMGYIYYKTNNLIYTSLFHFLNNVIFVVLIKFNAFGMKGLIDVEELSHVSREILIPSIAVLVIGLAAFIKSRPVKEGA
jgi:membrane protease YdiL (CAAX protease family)